MSLDTPAAAATKAEAKSNPRSPLEIIDEAKRDFALRKYGDASDKYGIALELLAEKHEEEEPVMAPIFHRYGRALLELAIANSGALGGGGGASAKEPKKTKEAASMASGSGASSIKAADPRFSFSGDAEDSDEEGASGGEEEEGAAEEVDEDSDLKAAYGVIDLARAIYSKALEAGADIQVETIEGEKWDELKIKTQLAEVHNDLGDVALELENFSEASQDYLASLEILSPLLHPHSRRLADAQLRLGLALEFHPDTAERTKAAEHVRAASTALKARMAAIEARQSAIQGGQIEAREQAAAAEAREEAATEESGEANTKSKGKGKGPSVPGATERDDVLAMSADKLKAEMAEMKEILAELDVKLEEFALAAKEGGTTEEGFVPTDKEALNKAVQDAFASASGGSSTSVSASNVSSKPVNDLSALVKKKKKSVVEADLSVQDGKRKAEGGSQPQAVDPVSKKARVEDVGEDEKAS